MITGIDAGKLAKLQSLIENGKEKQFYNWRVWRDHVRPEVLRLDHNECYYCHKAVNNRTAIVHHVELLTARPDLALSIYTPDGRRQLVTVCKACHELQHPEVLQHQARAAKAEPITAECWQ